MPISVISFGTVSIVFAPTVNTGPVVSHIVIPFRIAAHMDRVSNHGSPGRMEDNRSWQSAGGNNFKCTPPQEVEEVSTINKFTWLIVIDKSKHIDKSIQIEIFSINQCTN